MSSAPTIDVELVLVGMLFVEGGYGVVSVTDGPAGSELARGAVQLGESGTVVLDVVAGTLEVSAWTQGCAPSGCRPLSDSELDASRPGTDLCSTMVTVPAADSASAQPTRLRYRTGVLAPGDTQVTCRLEVSSGDG